MYSNCKEGAWYIWVENGARPQQHQLACRRTTSGDLSHRRISRGEPPPHQRVMLSNLGKRHARKSGTFVTSLVRAKGKHDGIAQISIRR